MKKKMIILFSILALTSCERVRLNTSIDESSIRDQLSQASDISDILSIIDGLSIGSTDKKETPEILFIGSDSTNKEAFTGLDLFSGSANITYYTESDEVPYTKEDLQKYDSVILSDVDVTMLENAQSFIDNVSSLASEGLNVLTLGDTSLDNTTIDPSSYQKMLPFKETDEPIAVVFLIDNSGSMGTDQMNIAKNGAIKCLNQLDDNDYVGVVTFESDVKVVQPLTPASEKTTITKNIRKIQSAGGTIMAHGLDKCRKMLANSTVAPSNKFIIGLSDGLPSDESAALNSAKKLAQGNISCSFLNIANSSGETFLKNLTKKTNGYYKYVSSANKIVAVMEEMTETIIRDGQIGSTADVMVTELGKNVFSTINSEIEKIDGFYKKNTRDDAYTLLTVNETYDIYDEDDHLIRQTTSYPLFSYLNYGQGIICSFTSSISSNWTINFRNSSTGLSILKSIARLIANI